MTIPGRVNETETEGKGNQKDGKGEVNLALLDCLRPLSRVRQDAGCDGMGGGTTFGVVYWRRFGGVMKKGDFA
jgi:hypothetical protein